MTRERKQPSCWQTLCCIAAGARHSEDHLTPPLSVASSTVRSIALDAELDQAGGMAAGVRYKPVYSRRNANGAWGPCIAACGVRPLHTMSMHEVVAVGESRRWSPKSAPGAMYPRGCGMGTFVLESQEVEVVGRGGGQKTCREYSPVGGPGASSARRPSPAGHSPDSLPGRPDSNLSARSGIEAIVSGRARQEPKKELQLPALTIAPRLDASLSPKFSELATEGGAYTPTACTPYSAFTPTSAYSYSVSEQFSTVGGFDPASIQWGGFLGRGNFSTVYKGRIDGIDYGVKIIRNPVSKGTERLAGFMAKNVLHPNLVRVCGVKSVTVHCSLEDAHTPQRSMERSMSMVSQGEAYPEGFLNSGRTGKTELTILDDDKSEFSMLARNIPHKGGTGREDTETWVLMEYCDAGTLDKAIERGLLCEGMRFDKPKMLHVLFAALEIASAMTHLHSCGIIHGDLKPENVLLQSCDPSPMGMEFTCKVGDFGLSRRTSIHATQQNDSFNCGTVAYMAPEVLRDNTSTYAADVFSFGILLWEMLSGRKAFASLSQPATLVAIVEGRRPKVPAFFPSWYAQLLEDCWNHNRQARPNFADIVERINLMVLAFERPRTPEQFMPESYSSNHSERIVAYQGAQQFMEGDLHTNPFYEHDQDHPEGMFEQAGYPVAEASFHSISFDDMACGANAPLAPTGSVLPSPRRGRQHARAKRNTLSDNSLPDLKECDPQAELTDSPTPTPAEEAPSSSAKSQPQQPRQRPPTPPTQELSSHPVDASEESEIVTRFRKFSASLRRAGPSRSSPVPEDRVTLLGPPKKVTARMQGSGESLRESTRRVSGLSTEPSTPRSSCTTPSGDSEYWGSDWSPPHTAGQPQRLSARGKRLDDADKDAGRRAGRVVRREAAGQDWHGPGGPARALRQSVGPDDVRGFYWGLGQGHVPHTPREDRGAGE
ncbi:unnamed protein product [Ostreobium quekettii]|uniref:Protein kinase domain-containing protein n=1 Tax=Ostreobium quekettii TaxID=121088 RepID=A0A8S1J9A1_9CHLO|nr:unnamed protein product [Ostreobium quekettii]